MKTGCNQITNKHIDCSEKPQIRILYFIWIRKLYSLLLSISFMQNTVNRFNIIRKNLIIPFSKEKFTFLATRFQNELELYEFRSNSNILKSYSANRGLRPNTLEYREKTKIVYKKKKKVIKKRSKLKKK